VIIPPHRLILLDTNVLIHLARNDVTGQAIETQYSLTHRPERPLLSTIVEGAVLSFAYYRQWGNEKIQRLRLLLKNLVRVEAGLPEVVECYARLSALARSQGKTMGQNDLWIAATAQAVNALLLTSDQDFLWLSPEYIQLILV